MNWRDYQNQCAVLFESLGCDVKIEATVEGVRGTHKIDVLVTFNRFGIQTKWILECKSWKTKVPKEKILVLKQIVEDVGADRGILVSRSGYQSGVVRAAHKVNITLMSLDDLKEAAHGDLLLFLLQNLERKATELSRKLHSLFTNEKLNANMSTWKLNPGVDGKSVQRAIADLSVLKFGFDQVRLGQSRFPVKFDPSGTRVVRAETLEEFVDLAAKLVDDVQLLVDVSLAAGTT
ncbi:MAG: restriction endonuclease [Alphaproteobacteria bacterium]|nr:restriction endonuclease [Alphaproteobacteria bacterium]